MTKLNDLTRETDLMDNELEEWYNLHKFYISDYQTKDLANYLKVNPRTIQRWVKGRFKPNKEQLAQISKYLTTRKETQETS